MECSQCGSRDIDLNEAAGAATCVSCGHVLEENAIVSSIEFQESNDRSHVIGQFVSANCSKPYNSGNRARGRYGNTRESRDATLAAARRNIQQVSSSLRLPNIYVDKAYRLYQLALQRNFIFGRRQMHVVATCLYTICRQEKSPHLLIDFSDALQVNVYILGKSFLQFARILNLTLPIIDPSLYIHRFSARLELGDKMNLVSTTALRIVTRLKKDWINSGRRPDGICAAAMLIAARSHGFHKSQADISKIFRVSSDTLMKRLQDFRQTPSAQLTIDEFHQHDSAIEFDPPSFIRSQLQTHNGDVCMNLNENEDDVDLEENASHGGKNKKLVRCAAAAGAGEDDDDENLFPSDDEGDDDLKRPQLTSGSGTLTKIDGVSIVVPMPGSLSQLKKLSKTKAQKVQASKDMYCEIYDDIARTAQEALGESAPEPGSEDGPSAINSVLALRKEALDVKLHWDQRLQGVVKGKRKRIDVLSEDWKVETAKREDVSAEPADSAAVTAVSSAPAASSTSVAESTITAVVLQRPVVFASAASNAIDDAEIECYILNDEEKQKRQEIRQQMYGEFMTERAKRKQEKATEEEEAGAKAAALGKPRKKWTRRESGFRGATAGEPVPDGPKSKSRKINYANEIHLMLQDAYPSDATGEPAAAALPVHASASAGDNAVAADVHMSSNSAAHALGVGREDDEDEDEYAYGMDQESDPEEVDFY